ncbi:hypothetical protein D1092_07060 [Bartonella krasnovii]|uniref:Uncharacterized protein n=1 Tax=Bartonella krasnovii TaxID=2267275 RepID=A0A5B9D2Y1_9HYPH|nr:hypothetical protein D1092_07060 [Bartonella krasnovii]
MLWRWVLWWCGFCGGGCCGGGCCGGGCCGGGCCGGCYGGGGCCGGEGAVVGAVAVGADLFLAEIS